MGAGQSQPATESDRQPEVVRIDRSEIPEEYKTVGVSGAVVNRVNAQNRPFGAGAAADIDVEKLRAELARERDEKDRLRNEMSKLSELQQRSLQGKSPAVAVDDIEDIKKVFDETVDRVQKQFFAYQRENVCEGNEKEIMDCLRSNPNRVLKCSNLVSSYEQCVANFRQEVLKGN